MRYLVGLPLRDEESADFNALIRKYRYLAPRLKITLGPHVTIIRPGQAAVSPKQTKLLFKQLDVTIPAFTVKFRSFDAFIGRNCAVYAKPKHTKEFIDLHSICSNFATRVLEQTTEFGFHPHLTLINRLKEDSALSLLEELKKLNFTQDFTFDKLVLYQKETGDPFWQPLASKKLLISE